jgi:peptide/nickel transport system substrate-binding protein
MVMPLMRASLAAAAMLGLMAFTAPAQAAGGTITLAVGADVFTTDPHKISGGGEYLFHTQVFESLYGHDLQGKLEPLLATGHTLSPDGLTYTFTLRPNVKWHDGTPFTAADVRYSWERAIDPVVKNPRASIVASNFKDVEIVDDMTVKIQLKKVDAALLENLGEFWYIVPKDYASKLTPEQFAEKPIGTGPYKFVERKLKESITLDAFKQHWGRVPDVDRVVMRIIQDSQTRVAMLKTGEADLIVDVPPQVAKEIEGGADTKLYRLPSFQNIYLSVSNRKKDSAFTDARVRQAISYAIDRKTLVQKLMLGEAHITASPCEEQILGCDIGKQPYAFDPNKAKALLAEAKFDTSKTYRFVGLAPGRTPQSKEIAEAISFYLGRVGIKMQLDIMEYGAWLAFIAAKRYDDADLVYFTWTDYNADPSGRLPRSMRTDGSLSLNSYPEIDAMIDASNNFVDPAERLAHLRKMWTWIYDNVPQVPLWTVNMLYGARKNIEWTPEPGVSWPVLWKIRKN